MYGIMCTLSILHEHNDQWVYAASHSFIDDNAELLAFNLSQKVTLNCTFWLLITIAIEDGMINNFA